MHTCSGSSNQCHERVDRGRMAVQVSLAKQLLERNQKGLPIHKVPSG